MAKIAGEIEATDGGLSFNEATDRYVMIDARLPVQPPEWADFASLQRYRVQMWRQLTIANGTTSSEKWMGINGTSSIDTVAGPQSAAWVEYDANGQDPANPAGHSLEMVAFTSTTTEPRRIGPETEATLIYQATTVNSELLALCMIMENDNAFNTSDPSSTASYEITGRNTAVYAPYLANESYSAWLAQCIQAQDENKILYATTQYWSVPV